MQPKVCFKKSISWWSMCTIFLPHHAHVYNVFFSLFVWHEQVKIDHKRAQPRPSNEWGINVRELSETIETRLQRFFFVCLTRASKEGSQMRTATPFAWINKKRARIIWHNRNSQSQFSRQLNWRRNYFSCRLQEDRTYKGFAWQPCHMSHVTWHNFIVPAVQNLCSWY